MATEPFLVNPRRMRRRTRRRSRRNPVGDEVVILGALAGNPRRRATMATRRRRRRRRAAARGRGWFLNAPRRRRRRRRTYAFNAPRRHRRRRRARFAFNEPRRRHARRHRGYRRNPNGGGGFALMRPMTWVPYVATGGVAAVMTAAAPRFMGPAVTPMWAYGIQAAVAIGGSMALPMLGFRAMHGLVWFVVSGAVIAADMITRYAMPAMGLAAYPYDTHQALSGMGQEPYYPPRLSNGYTPGVSAYPYEWQLSDGVGAYEPVPGAVAPFEVPYGHAG